MSKVQVLEWENETKSEQTAHGIQTAQQSTPDEEKGNRVLLQIGGGRLWLARFV